MSHRGGDSLSIGEFSRRTLVSARALRHYDAIGLLKPAVVDRDTGYRYYAPSQEADARRIRRLRDVGIPLEEVRDLLDDADWPALRPALERRRLALEARIEEDRAALNQLDHWIETGGEPMSFDVSMKTLEPEAIATFRWRGRASDPTQFDTSRFVDLGVAVAEAEGTFVAAIGIANVYDVDGVADLDLGFVTEELLPPANGYVSRVLDGGEFASLVFERWADKPAAYDALESWLLASGRRRRGPSRERGPLVWPATPRSADAVVVEPSPEGWPVEILMPIT